MGLTDKLPSDNGVPAIFGTIVPLTKHVRPKRKQEKFDSETPAVFATKVKEVSSVKSLFSRLIFRTYVCIMKMR